MKKRRFCHLKESWLSRSFLPSTFQFHWIGGVTCSTLFCNLRVARWITSIRRGIFEQREREQQGKIITLITQIGGGLTKTTFFCCCFGRSQSLGITAWRKLQNSTAIHIFNIEIIAFWLQFGPTFWHSKSFKQCVVCLALLVLFLKIQQMI